MNNKQSNNIKGNILIVDDTLHNLRLLSNVLKEAGYKVRGVSNGEMALTVIEHAPPNLILLDINMPDMNGYQVCEYLKSKPQTQDIPIIFLSAKDEAWDKVKAFSVGGADYITKPFQMEEVLARVESHLAKHKLEQQLKQTNDLLEQRVFERTSELSNTIQILEEEIKKRKQAELALQLYAERLHVFHKIDQEILMAQSPQDIARVVLEHIKQLIPCDQSSITLYDNKTNKVQVLAVNSNSNTALEEEHMPLVSYGITTPNTITTPRLIKNISSLPNPLPIEKQLIKTGLQSVISVPFVSQNELLGFLNLAVTPPNTFNTDQFSIAQEIAAQLLVAILQTRLYQNLQYQMQSLEKAQTQLIHSEKMTALGRLVTSITHEINNPLQSVQTCLTLTKEELDNEQRQDKIEQYLNIVENEVERISKIVRRIRDFYRPARQEIKQVNLPKIIGSVLQLTNEKLQENNIIIKQAWIDDLPNIQANADHLKQVFLNLILNAIDIMPNGGKLYISSAIDQINSKKGTLPIPAVRLEFSDTGSGMSQETLSHLFEPFFTTKKNGSGLGLYISYGIIETHNGKITVSSQLGLGTTFTILLPIKQTQVAS